VRIFTYILMLFIVLLGVTFACLNAEPVHINYYIGQGLLPLSFLLVLALGFGLCVGLFVSLTVYMRLKTENFHLKSRTKLAEKEVGNLRAIPLKNH